MDYLLGFFVALFGIVLTIIGASLMSVTPFWFVFCLLGGMLIAIGIREALDT